MGSNPSNDFYVLEIQKHAVGVSFAHSLVILRGIMIIFHETYNDTLGLILSPRRYRYTVGLP